MYDYLNFAGPVCDCPLLRKLVEQLKPTGGEPLAQVAMRMIQLIAGKFLYEQGVTSSASPISEILSHGRGYARISRI